MAKRRLKLKVRLPEYRSPRYAWRKAIHRAALDEMKEKKVYYDRNIKLALHIRFYFDRMKLSFVDVDNRLKDVMDALQGRAGGPKKERRLQPIIPNDNQIYRVVVEKSPPPKQSHGLGHLVISKFEGPNYH